MVLHPALGQRHPHAAAESLGQRLRADGGQVAQGAGSQAGN